MPDVLQLSDEDQALLDKGRWAQRGGLGEHPALLVIDPQNYMVGRRGGPHDDFPLSCGDQAWEAVDAIASLLRAARGSGVPVIYTRFVLARDGSDGGMFSRKIGVPPTEENAFFEGTFGAEIADAVKPVSGDLVLVKKKSSAFFGTPLLAHLIERGIDTVVVTGGATCNCVRATVNDAISHNFRVIVPREAVFDRIRMSHEISLFDMNRFLADVIPVDEVAAYLEGRAAR